MTFWPLAPRVFRRLIDAVTRFGRAWSRDHAALMAAGVAFYAIFSIAPLLSLMMTAASFFWTREGAREQVIESIRQFVSPRTAAALSDIAETVASRRSSGLTIFSVVLLMFGASAVFNHLRTALHIILDVPRNERRAWLNLAISRLIAVAMVIAVMLFLMLSLAVTASVTLAIRFFPDRVPADYVVWQVVDLAFSAGMLAFLAMLALRYVPDIRMPWKYVMRGAAAAALLFSAGRYAVAAYLRNANILSVYGAAGSLFIVLLAVYFAVLSLFVGAEVMALSVRAGQPSGAAGAAPPPAP
ncbi:MAG TPA: YihY/virulence factor BrkB family protein [Thermoanaerobaculia bacterium]|nr:YihY/virulence factor BrkB family protein [Thermoanaerobaculia bacterium]